jgi:hypothetical protein
MVQCIFAHGANLGVMGPGVRGRVAAVAGAAAVAVDPLQPPGREMGGKFADGARCGGRMALLSGGGGGGGEVGGAHDARVHHIAGEVGGLDERACGESRGGRGEAGVSRVLNVTMNDGSLAMVAVGSGGGRFAFQRRSIMGSRGEFRDGGSRSVRPRVGVASRGQGTTPKGQMFSRLAQRLRRERRGDVSRGVGHALGTLSVKCQVGSYRVNG